MMGPTLIERLIDRGEASTKVSIASLRESLRRDLESALNSRRRLTSWPRELEQLDCSLVNYGLDDIVHESLSGTEFRERFVEEVELLIRRLEPRIGRFDVTILPNKDELDRTLRFRINGTVTLGGERQELFFDSHVDPVRSYLVMRG